MLDAVQLTGLSRSEIYRLISEGLIRSFVYTFREDSKTGIRLIDLPHLAKYLDERAAQALAEKEGK
jgi:hypothetical protein